MTAIERERQGTQYMKRYYNWYVFLHILTMNEVITHMSAYI